MEQYNDIYNDLEHVQENNNVDMKGELQNYLKTLSGGEKTGNKEEVNDGPDDFSFENNTQGLQYRSL